MSRMAYRVFKHFDKIVDEVKSVVVFPKKMIAISGIVEKPTYYPEKLRKSKKEMWIDNFKWLCRYHELNQYYTSYGLDIAEWRKPEDFICYRDFMRMRNDGNQTEKLTISGHYNYIVLLRDKYVFSAYLTSMLGSQYVAANRALISDGKAFICSTNTWTEIEELLTEGSSLVYKVLDGECADGVMLVEVKNDLVIADGRQYTKKEFVDKINCKKIIVQNVITQHQAMQAFKTRSVNTLRIITIKGNSGVVNVFAAFLRLSGSADSFVDNRAKGGLGIGINLENGRLMKYGFPHDAFGVKQEVHSLSGIRFEGYQLPYWKNTIDLVCNAHKQFYDLQSIGWDVVLTDTGPVLLEGNDDWEISGPQDTYGGLRKRWFELVNR